METEHLLVVLQTYSESNALTEKKTDFRYSNTPKIEVSRRCILSLVHSLNYAKCRNSNLQIQLEILDDNSCEEFLTDLNFILSIAQFPCTITNLGGNGIMSSITSCYECAKEKVRDYVYFVQDDFLHSEHAIHLMLQNYKKFYYFLNNDLTLSGWHDTKYLLPDTIQLGCRVVPGIEGYWRTVPGTHFTMMTSANLFLKNFNLFEEFGKKQYHDVNAENTTINHLHTTLGHYAFCPIQSLVLEIQWEVHKDPFIPWEEWWNKYDVNKFFYRNSLLPTDYYYIQNIKK